MVGLRYVGELYRRRAALRLAMTMKEKAKIGIGRLHFDDCEGTSIVYSPEPLVEHLKSESCIRVSH